MTYIITPSYDAIPVDPTTTFSIQTRLYYGKVCGYFITMGQDAIKISPMFDIADPISDISTISPNDYEDRRTTAELDAIEWLEDFLVRLHKRPAVIHCTTDGEMFTS